MYREQNLRSADRRLPSRWAGRDGTLLLLWLLASVVVVAVAIALTWQAATHLLRQELRAAATDWAAYLVDHVEDLDQAMTSGELSPASLDVLRTAAGLGPIFRYQLYDRRGQAVFGSERDADGVVNAGEIDALDDAPPLQDVLDAERPIVKLHQHRNTEQHLPALYGQIYLPIASSNQVLGMVEVHIDPTEKAARYRHEFVVFATGLTLLILFAMALPMTLVWRKTKQRELAERKLHAMAHTDPLTKLANRTEFCGRLDNALAEAGRYNNLLALFWLDLDRFKTINDALGHPIGDSLLCQVAARLRQSLRDRDIVARLGGDEFALVQADCGNQHQAAELAQRLIEVLAVPFDVEGHHVVIGVSIGIVFAPHDGREVDDLLKKADIALYRAKDAGRSTYRFFKPDMEARSAVRHALEEDLRLAVQSNQLRLHYQPQVSLDTGRIVGFEALLRWHHPSFGHMPPGEVVALAEETGLIMPLGFWALTQACADATTWPEEIKVSVNISAVQFKHTNLEDLVGDALNMSGLAPDRLDLEITESIVMEDSRTTIARLRKLRRLGIHLSMDDFGTGYSSLSRLRHLPFDRLKVDRSFVRELGGNRDDDAIVHAIVTLGQSLDMQIIAEGVETDAQLGRLLLENCDMAQGFFFGRPVPASEIGRQLGRYNPDKSVGLHAPREQALPLLPAVDRATTADMAKPDDVTEVDAMARLGEAVG